MSKKIVCFGEIMMRYKTPRMLKFLQAFPGSQEATFGGAEANVAASIAQLGNRASFFVTSLPNHEIADACVNQLRGLSVNVQYINRTNVGRLGVYYIEAGANQRPSKVIYDRSYSSVSLVDASAYNWDTIFENGDAFHITGITPSLSKQAADTALTALKEAKRRNLTTFCDLNFRKKLWKWEEGTDAKTLARKVMSEIVPYVDIVIANEEDTSDVLDIQAENTNIESGHIDNQAYIGVAQEVVKKYPNVKKVAITLRESISASHNNWGAMLYNAESKEASFAPLNNGAYNPYCITNIVDRVGGGDSFAAGLIYALTDDELSSDTSAISFAVATSCLAHSIEGDINFTTRNEALTLMKGNASGRVQR